MFSECSSLKELNIKSFNINSETYLYDMFTGCSDELKDKITKLYSNIPIDKVFGN